MVKVSVVIPVYNCKRYVVEAVDSILKQTYKDFEILLLDDGCTDGTSEILKTLAKKDARVRLIVNKKNMGMTATMNRGLREARGEYIARMDADDVAKKNRFAKQVQFLDKHPEIALLGTAADIINNKGVVTGSLAYVTTHDEIKRHMMERNQFIHPSTMYRRSVLNDVGYYDVNFKIAQDYEYFSRMIVAHNASNLSEKLMQYRWDFTQNAGFTSGKRQEREAILVRWRMITRLGWPFWQIIYMTRPVVSFFIPMNVKVWILKRVRK